MELYNRRNLYLHQQIGYHTQVPKTWEVTELCQQVFKSCNNFIFDMLDEGFYSDGPRYFQSKLIKENPEDWQISIFTTFGNAYQEVKENKSPIFFKDKFFVAAQDYQRLAVEELDDYYDQLITKYGKEIAQRTTLYHMLNCS
ncbi:hypothetical protein [Streptococcus parauberis]|uniref:hypothetical protein n=1 Tax=Streptococcus parauberis TaxID=1348 RepID=UPI0037948B4D